MCDFMVLGVPAGIRVTSVLLWFWVEWTVTDLICTASTLTAPLTSSLMSPWVGPAAEDLETP